MFDSSHDPKQLSTPKAPVFENLLTMQELLTMLKHQYSRYTVYRWVGQYGMPHKRIRGKLWFPKVQVTQWLLEGSPNEYLSKK